MNVGYLVSEWPGQSHVWAWREVCHLRELGLRVTLFSTRRPIQSARGKHSFVATAEAETHYLWPLNLGQIVVALLWAVCRPHRLAACLALSFNLAIDRQPSWQYVLPLLIPACRFAREVDRLKIEHLHTPIPGNSAILCMMVKRLTGVPYSMAIVAEFKAWGGAMREKFSEAAFVTVVGQWLLEQANQDFPDVDRCFVARHGVDTRIWQPQPRLSGTTPKRIFSAGRLVKVKGFDILLQAAAIVKANGLCFELRIAGDGDEHEALKALIYQLDLVSEVQLLGSLSEEACLTEMQVADVFALASYSEGLGVVYLEAMVVEAATIGTAVGGVVEIIRDRVNGLLVPPGDPEALAEAIIELLNDDQLRDRLGKAGRQTVIEHFDSRYGAEILRDLISKHHHDHHAVEFAVGQATMQGTLPTRLIGKKDAGKGLERVINRN